MTITRNRMLDNSKLTIVAVSGGADSMCLLHLLRQLDYPLVVAHLHHGLRGAEADRDAAFVRQASKEMGLECVLGRRDVRAYQKSAKLSPEAAAREMRHAFLRSVALGKGAQAIALAHTANDQIETLLLHLIRGAGIAGLAGMRPASGLLRRPMLSIWRDEIEAYLQRAGVEWREDSSNSDPSFLRNRIRHELLPLLENLNPGIREVLLRETRAFGRSQNRIDAELFRRLGLNSRQIEQAAAGKPVLISGGRRVSVDSRSDAEQPAEVRPAEFALQLQVPGKVSVAGLGTIRANFVSGPRDGSIGKPGANGTPAPPSLTAARGGSSTQYSELFDADRIGPQLTIRNRRLGDRFTPLGMAGTKKLQDFFIDEKVPERVRPRIPLVLAGDTIVWVTGLRIDDRFKVTPLTRRIVKLTFRPSTLRR